MVKDSDAQLLQKAEIGISEYLEEALKTGGIDRQLYAAAKQHTFPSLKRWLEDPAIRQYSPNLSNGLRIAIEKKQWKPIVDAYRQTVRFGTGGIRGMMAFDKGSIVRLKTKGLDASILKGPNTINNIVLLQTSAGVAAFGKSQNPEYKKIVIGYDSRIRGQDLAALVAQLFLAYDYTVYFFDAPCPYPEVTFAIPNLQADVGILISASHNDYRYNGYKLSCANGSQFDPEERDQMYNEFIAKADFGQIKLLPFNEAKPDKLIFLGGKEPIKKFNYGGKTIVDMHTRHVDHIKRFIFMKDLAQKQREAANPLRIAYCAFHGVGREAVPRLLNEVGFRNIKSVTYKGLNKLDGLFPCFRSDPGKEQQPDPGDPRAAHIAVNAFKHDFPGEFGKLDILIGTDPDADRCGIVVKVPKNQKHLYDGKDYVLLPADDAWALLLWYRVNQEKAANNGKKFIVLSHTTSDSITRLARKHDIGVVKTWVGFASLSAATRDVWEGKLQKILHLKEGRAEGDLLGVCHPFVCNCEGMDNGERSINVGALEQSNGFSILGGPPLDKRSMGENGHVRDKDGTFAALLLAELAAWAKEQNTTLIELLDNHIYLDPDIGLFVNLYEPDPLDGEYPGIEGDKLKKAILRRGLGYFQLALSGDLILGGLPVKSACIYRTGKYDAIYPPTYDFQFPDEGIRFFFDDARLSHLTVRPSGTGNSLRFHVQLHTTPTRSNLIAEKAKLRARGKAILDNIRKLLKAPRT